MGAFFLYRSDSAVLAKGAQQVFLRKGFAAPKQFTIGGWVLLTYRKMLVEDDNFLATPDGFAIFACGTVVYRSLGYHDTLEQLLDDFRTGKLERNQLLGNFVLLFWDGRCLFLLTDAVNAQRVFVHESGCCLSSSFLAILASSLHRLGLNRLAALERMSTGHIVSPDTLVNEIRQYNHDLALWLQDRTGIRVIENKPPVLLRTFHSVGFNESINCQLAVLRDYFLNINTLDREYHAELGLSSGFDSRLLLALSQYLSEKVPLHTHCTSEVHDFEVQVARKLAAVAGNPLTIVPTRRMDHQDETRMKEIVYDNLYFFDARPSNYMGAFSETYTAAYRKQVLGQNRLSLNGLGGELFRNVSSLSPGRFAWSEFMDFNVYYPCAHEVFAGDDRFRDMQEAMNKKLSERLCLDLSGQVDFWTARAYYARVHLPECECNVNNAYNQVAFLLTPFCELQITDEALKATPYIGTDGVYQAAMIEHLSPALASVMSHYGYPFSKVSRKALLAGRLKNVLPLRLRHLRASLLVKNDRRNTDFSMYRTAVQRSRTLQEIESALADVFPGADWSLAMRDYGQRWASIMVGSFLLEFQHQLRW